MKIFTDSDFKRMLKTQLINHLEDLGYDKNVSNMKKYEIVNIIKNKTDLYINYKKTVRDIIENSETNLIGEQKDKFISIFSFLQGISEKKKIIDKINNIFIPDISKFIVSKLEYLDYPTIKNRIALLQGGAGTGKTHLISNINYELNKVLKHSSDGSSTEIQVLAPTNKAIKVIKSKIYDILNKLEKEQVLQTTSLAFSTISKFLQQDIEYTTEGHVIYKTKISPYKNSYYRNLKYIIIDEASMISKNNWTDLNTFIFRKYPHIKILLIGDECQLPPVKEFSSIVFNVPCKRFRLNEILRTQSKEITEIYSFYRKAVINNSVIEELPPEKKDNPDFRYIKSFEEEIKNNFDVENDKIISYSNDSVDKYNEIVRNIVFNNPQEKYVLGEKIIFGTSIKNTSIDNGSIIEGTNYFYANDEGTVQGIEKTIINTNFAHREEKINLEKIFPEETFEVYKLHLLINNSIKIVYKIQEDSKIAFQDYFETVFERIKAISKKRKGNKSYISKLWNIFYIVKYTINIPIKYSYALTVYKSQGSTFKKIFIDMEDIYNCVKDNHILNKTLYTAVTRASEKINCYKPKISDYYLEDLKKFPFLKKHVKIDNKKALNILKDGKNIIYTRNEYQNKKCRKLIKGRIIHILHKRIYVGNSKFSWELKLKDDIIIYI